MEELDFTIEFKSDLQDETMEGALMEEAEGRLRELAAGHTDLTGAAVTIRKQAAEETALHEATVVAYVRPSNIAGSEKDRSPSAALNAALTAVERQVREKREKLAERWEQPEGGPVTQEVVEVIAAEERARDISEEVDESAGDEQ